MRHFTARLKALEREVRDIRHWFDALDAMLGLVDRPALRLVGAPKHRARVQHRPRRAVYSSVVLAIVGGAAFVGAPDRFGTYAPPARTPPPAVRPGADPPMSAIRQFKLEPDITDRTWEPVPSPRLAPRSPTTAPSPRPSPTETTSPPPPPPPPTPSPTPTLPDESCSPDLPGLPDLIPG